MTSGLKIRLCCLLKTALRAESEVQWCPGKQHCSGRSSPLLCAGFDSFDSLKTACTNNHEQETYRNRKVSRNRIGNGPGEAFQFKTPYHLRFKTTQHFSTNSCACQTLGPVLCLLRCKSNDGIYFCQPTIATSPSSFLQWHVAQVLSYRLSSDH